MANRRIGYHTHDRTEWGSEMEKNCEGAQKVSGIGIRSDVLSGLQTQAARQSTLSKRCLHARPHRVQYRTWVDGATAGYKLVSAAVTLQPKPFGIDGFSCHLMVMIPLTVPQGEGQ